MKPTFISLFSGVGGFDLGLERAGFECIAQCDNDPFCNKVLAKHWPGVKRYDDVSKLGFKQFSATMAEPEAYSRWLGSREYHEQGKPFEIIYGKSIVASTRHVDLICGGFPCQDLSVAGKRAGLDGARSGLWFEFHRILSELRPAFALIENVPGLLSSNQGRDFGVVLAGLGELWPAVGWAVLDSQHFGVAQRRRRVYVIAGPSRECVQQILSLCESGDWNTQARRAEREDVAATIRGRSSSAGVNEPGRGGEDDANLHTLSADGFDASEDGTGRGTPLVATTLDTHLGDKQWLEDQNVTNYDFMRLAGAGVRRLTPVECERLQGFPDGHTCICGAYDEKPQRSRTQESAAGIPESAMSGVRSDAGKDRPSSRGRQHPEQRADEHRDPLRDLPREAPLGRGKSISTRGRATVRHGEDHGDGEGGLQPGRAGGRDHGEARHRDINPIQDREANPHVACKCPDGPRYKACGNAVTVPVIEYIGRRIREVLS